jgi:hypothetical protein
MQVDTISVRGSLAIFKITGTPHNRYLLMLEFFADNRGRGVKERVRQD